MARPKTIKPIPSNLITLNEYLANYSRKRNLDPIITKWYQRIDAVNTKRAKEEWDRIIKKFMSE